MGSRHEAPPGGRRSPGGRGHAPARPRGHAAARPRKWAAAVAPLLALTLLAGGWLRAGGAGEGAEDAAPRRCVTCASSRSARDRSPAVRSAWRSSSNRSRREPPEAIPEVSSGALEGGPGGGLSPAELAKAYEYSPTEGVPGQTIALIDAGNDPSIEEDLEVFDKNYGIPACTTANGCFKKVSETGSTTELPPNAGTRRWRRRSTSRRLAPSVDVQDPLVESKGGYADESEARPSSWERPRSPTRTVGRGSRR